MNLTKLFYLLATFLLTSSFYLGTNTAVLTCKSDSGKTTFVANLQDITSMFESAKFTIDNSTIEFDSNDKASVALDSKKGVFTLYIDGRKTFDYPNGKFIQFWAIPSSFKIIKEESGHKVYEFKAKIKGTDPRLTKKSNSSVIELNCKLEWEI